MKLRLELVVALVFPVPATRCLFLLLSDRSRWSHELSAIAAEPSMTVELLPVLRSLLDAHQLGLQHQTIGLWCCSRKPAKQPREMTLMTEP